MNGYLTRTWIAGLLASSLALGVPAEAEGDDLGAALRSGFPADLEIRLLEIQINGPADACTAENLDACSQPQTPNVLPAGAGSVGIDKLWLNRRELDKGKQRLTGSPVLSKRFDAELNEIAATLRADRPWLAKGDVR